jgi:hypothetical protein
MRSNLPGAVQVGSVSVDHSPQACVTPSHFGSSRRGAKKTPTAIADSRRTAAAIIMIILRFFIVSLCNSFLKVSL